MDKEEEIEVAKFNCNGCGKNEWRRQENFKYALLICIHCGHRTNVAHKYDHPVPKKWR